MKTPEFVETTGLGLSTIEKLETGRLRLSEENARLIARVTGVNFDWLFKGDPSAPIMGSGFTPYTIDDYRIAQSKTARLPEGVRVRRDLQQAHGSGLIFGELLSCAFAKAMSKGNNEFQELKKRVEKFVNSICEEVGPPPDDYMEMRYRSEVLVTRQDGSISELVTASPKEIRAAEIKRSKQFLDKSTEEMEYFMRQKDHSFHGELKSRLAMVLAQRALMERADLENDRFPFHFMGQWKIIRPANGFDMKARPTKQPASNVKKESQPAKKTQRKNKAKS